MMSFSVGANTLWSTVPAFHCVRFVERAAANSERIESESFVRRRSRSWRAKAVQNDVLKRSIVSRRVEHSYSLWSRLRDTRIPPQFTKFRRCSLRLSFSDSSRPVRDDNHQLFAIVARIRSYGHQKRAMQTLHFLFWRSSSSWSFALRRQTQCFQYSSNLLVRLSIFWQNLPKSCPNSIGVRRHQLVTAKLSPWLLIYTNWFIHRPNVSIGFNQSVY